MMFNGARILVAPLDWGLGHAARCVPVIRELIAQGAEPVIGADKGPLALLLGEFPQLLHIVIPGIEVRYAKGRSQAWMMARQFPAMLRSVREERALFDRVQRDLKLAAVISDQRFGIRAEHLPSVLITHQVFPFSPMAQGVVRRINLHHVRRFHQCWIPDEEITPGLAGELSHGSRMPTNVRYIGPISRFANEANSAAKRHRIVAVISGPEPQRTLLENTLRTQLQQIAGEHLMVVGKPGMPNQEQIGNVTVCGHHNASALCAAMRGADLIISRTGYTTLMDLASIGRSALVIPTPGQEEQEYLGQLHSTTGRFMVQAQDAIHIHAALAHPPTAGVSVTPPSSGLARAVQGLAALLHR